VPVVVPLVVLLVVPLEVPPLVALGTLPGRPGALPVIVGTWPGSAGTDGTVGPPLVVPGLVPVVVAVPEPVITGVLPSAPVDVLGGVMTTVLPPPVVAPVVVPAVPVAPGVPVDPVVVLVEPDVPPAPRTAGVPSGNRHVTSRFEQKSGIVVRSLDASAAKLLDMDPPATAAATAKKMNLRVVMEGSPLGSDTRRLVQGPGHPQSAMVTS
jgi:hypothetical protein